MGFVSNPFRMPGQPPAQGEVVATFNEYDQAVAFVENLVTKDFPPAAIAIVGNDLRSVERIRGRLSYATVALRGAMNGAWFGFILGLVFLPKVLTDGQELMMVLLIGGGIGMLLNVGRFSMVARKRGFISVAQFVAKEYQVQVQGDLAGQARQISGL